MSVSSDEINLLVQHYLQELGYNHTAFAFGCESKIPTKQIAKRKVQPGALVYLIQKGIMYAEMESAASAALAEPQTQFARQLSLLRTSLRQSTDLVEELCQASRRTKVLPTSDQSEIRPFYLDPQTSLFLEGHTEAALVCSWSPDSQFLATGGADGYVIVWRFERLENGLCVIHGDAAVLRPAGDDSQNPDVTGITWHPKDPVLAVGTVGGAVVVYKEGQEIGRAVNSEAPVVAIRFSDDGQLLLVAGVDGSVSVFDQTMKQLNSWKVQGEVTNAVFFANGRIAVSTKNLVVEVVPDSPQPVQVLQARGDIVDLAVNAKQGFCAVADRAGYVTLVDMNMTTSHTMQVHRAGVCQVAWSSVANMYATGGADGSVGIVNIREQAPSAVMENHPGPAYAVVCDPVGRYVASASADTLNIWSAAAKRLLVSFRSVACQIIDISWSPDGRFLTILLVSGQVAVIDFEQIC